jgi:RNA polymerase sigma factor (sigma-70 family)
MTAALRAKDLPRKDLPQKDLPQKDLPQKDLLQKDLLQKDLLQKDSLQKELPLTNLAQAADREPANVTNQAGQNSDGGAEELLPAFGETGDGTGEDEANADVDWKDLVTRIQRGDDSGMEDLYRLFSRGIRFYLCRQLGMQELDDKVHDTFLIVVQAIKRGDLREPERLMGFVRTVVRRQVAAHIDQVVHSRRDELHLDVGVRVADGGRNPEQHMAFQQKVDFMLEILNELSGRDREILTRFYLDERTQEEICQDMALTETQFRLLKSRAKARFGELGKRRLQQKMLAPFFSRVSSR